MPQEELIQTLIVSPDSIIYEGKAKQLVVPSIHDDLAILPDHAPLYAEVKEGEIKLTTRSNEVKTFSAENGIMRVKQNKVSIILGFK